MENKIRYVSILGISKCLDTYGGKFKSVYPNFGI